MSSRPNRRRPTGRTARPRGSGESGRNARLRAEATARESARRTRRRWVVIGVVAVAVLVIGAGIVVGPQLGGGDDAGPDALEVVETVPAEARTPQRVLDGEPVVFGADGATHTLTVWSDFSCPYCAEFAADYREVLSEATDAGQVGVAVMPVTFVAPPSSTLAGNAFVCAADAGFGEAYHDALFASSSDGWGEERLLELGELVAPAPGEAFTRCVQDSTRQPYLDSVDAAARAAGVESTPTVLLDGVVLDLATTTPASLAEQLQETT